MKGIGSILLFVLISANTAAQIRNSLWDVQGITDVPRFTKVLKDSVYEIIYTGLPYKGAIKKTFAYYATPGSLIGKVDTVRNLPAVILVHGGGGTAFPGWVKEWARRGYAALAMDTRGNYPDGKHLQDGFQETNNSTPVYEVSMPLTEQWFFQAVSDIIIAHNLVRSFPEIDSNKTALAGISWGSVLSLVTAGEIRDLKQLPVSMVVVFFLPAPKWVSGSIHYRLPIRKSGSVNMIQPIMFLISHILFYLLTVQMILLSI
jgi:cephalosporin-C deacetylase-like acetyl esterase